MLPTEISQWLILWGRSPAALKKFTLTDYNFARG